MKRIVTFLFAAAQQGPGVWGRTKTLGKGGDRSAATRG